MLAIRAFLAWISSDYFESLLLPQLLRGENDSKQSDEFQAIDRLVWFLIICKAMCHFQARAIHKKFIYAWAEYYLQPATKSQPQLDDIAHEQTIICRQLFAGHLVGSRPMKRKKHLPHSCTGNWYFACVSSVRNRGSWFDSNLCPVQVTKSRVELLFSGFILRWNPPENWVILIFSGQKPCTRII